MGDVDPVAAATNAILREFEARKIPYALGGALALAYWAEPRATRDVDLNVFLAEELADKVVGALQAAGCTVDADAAMARVRDRGDLVAHYSAIRVDVFFPFHPFHESVRDRIKVAETPSGRRPVLSAEDLIIFKVLFSRPKDWVDIQAMVFAQGARLDRAYLRLWLTEILGSGDERMVRLDGIIDTSA